MPKINIEPHPFTIRDEDLFPQDGRAVINVNALPCGVCGDQPGQGMHKPPPLPVSRVIADEVARTLAGAGLLPLGQVVDAGLGARAAFTAIQQVREVLEKMSGEEAYQDPTDGGGYVFGDIDKRLDGLLTELRREGGRKL